MESNFFNNQEKPLEKKSQVTVVDYSDERIFKEKILTAKQLKPINLAHISKEITSKNISQGKVGNCYLLSAVIAIIEYDPNILKKIIVFNKNKFHVTLYDANNPDHAYVYILDPTKVVGISASDHTHDLIFILEKAYALHRIHLESKPLTPEQARIKEIYVNNKEDYESTYKVLLAEKRQKMDEVKKHIKIEMKAILSQLGKDKDVSKIDNDPKKQELLQYLIQYNWQIDTALFEYLNSQFPEYNFLGFEFQLTINAIKGARLDYSTGLSGGNSMQTFVALLGNIPIEFIPISQPYTVPELLLLLSQIAPSPPEYFTEEIHDFLSTVFQNNNFAKDFFVNSLKNTDPTIFWNELAEKKSTSKVSAQIFLPQFFQDQINWLPDADGLLATVLLLLDAFIQNEFLFQRGTGQYTAKQLALYEKISKALSDGKLVTFATRERVSRDPENTKGLLSGHEYFVSNAFQKNNLLFFEIRNVWSREIREYYFKKKTVNNREIQVLTAEGKKQLSPRLFIQSLDLIGYKTSPRLIKRTQVAKPNLPEERIADGFFAIELNDLMKRFSNAVIATPPTKTSQQQLVP